MHLIRNLSHIPTNLTHCVATIGNFDGIHAGHRAVLSDLKARSKALGLPTVVISFEPLPAEFFSPAPPTRIYPLRDKARMLNRLGIDYFVCLTFDRNFSQIEADDFVKQVLINRLGVKHLTVGDDFRFGKGRTGDFTLLKDIGSTHGMDVNDTPTLLESNERISSTRIRALLQKGDLNTANCILVDTFQLSGRIRHGDKLGRTIGFPTINLKLPDNIALKHGIYAVKVYGIKNHEVVFGAASLGKRPTVNGEDMRLETYLFDFDKEVYGQYVCIEPIHLIREEKHFPSIEIMTTQIKQDCEEIRNLLSSQKK